ncbi:YqaA family protein [Oleiharenicola lentus]|uniref:YqaA family protein n=1 Tax=Oleiharenicola lentus TaxID=2508720 RepID=UPI003F661820
MPTSTALDAHERRGLWLAAVWGFAEATFFFVVPDVLTSRLVLKRARVGFLACLASLVGALLGGIVLFYVGSQSGLRADALTAIDYVPGVSPAIIAKAQAGLAEHGLVALFVGVLSGIPYKLYALQTPLVGLAFGDFLIASAVARLSRFVLVTGLSWLTGATVFHNLSAQAKLRIHAGAWAVFYAVYFWRMGL